MLKVKVYALLFTVLITKPFKGDRVLHVILFLLTVILLMKLLYALFFVVVFF